VQSRFVITEFFRKPDCDNGIVALWYYKNTNIVKREIIFEGSKFFCDTFYDSLGKRHRNNDEPAMVYSDGHMQWYNHGDRHRGHFKPAIIRENGECEYWVYGELRFKTGSKNVYENYLNVG